MAQIPSILVFTLASWSSSPPLHIGGPHNSRAGTNMALSQVIYQWHKIAQVHALLAVAGYFGIEWILSWFSPLAVRQLCSGGSGGISCHLVGFEGTLPIERVERLIYGNYNNRLSYAASTTPFSKNLRHHKLRVGVEPTDPEFWNKQCIELKVPSTHRLFTLVDTGRREADAPGIPDSSSALLLFLLLMKQSFGDMRSS
ncbi:hypothetical protein BO71DRAFT_481134 [Aspergillus ellipticus CBS 707.79]|uniref:Uncharacterized protein n=1 Tax=Aspergillus ellipticus CBS 707.79 TaxID=1448320 RepID=A0A319E1B8_9EURO|nr:hypothetical protein BO71DRAFT_481134 [Aspergillus ellipticus CBS 707.79]